MEPSATEQAASAELASVSTLLAQDLRARGVEVVFGLLSDDIIDLVAALQVEGIQYCRSRHETQAVAMAEGYAFATGELGVVAVGRGAGSTNALTGAVYASRTGSRVLIMIGEAPVAYGSINEMGPDIKRIDGLGAAGMYTAAGLKTFTVTSPALGRPMLTEALSHADLGRASVLHLPTNILGAQLTPAEAPAPSPAAPPRPPGPAEPASIETALAVLANSRRPLIMAGWGAHAAGARQALEALAERIGAMLATSLKGKDLFRGSDYDLGILGSFSHSAARRFVDQADCVLVVGAGLNLYTMSHGNTLPRVPVIQIDADRSHIGRWTTVQVPLVGDARLIAEQLLEAIPARPDEDKPFHTPENRRILAEFEHTQDFEDLSRPRNVDPRTLGLVLDEVLPAERTLVYDAGNFIGVIPYLSAADPDHTKMTSETGSIGLGFGTALGVARGRPQSTTVLVIGDGGLMMQLGELETAVREELRMVIVVMNDRAYGAERHLLDFRGLPITTAIFPEADFAALAAELGMESHTVATLDEARELGPLLADVSGPVLVDCLIDPAVQAPFILEIGGLLDD